ncbi:MAG: hypothetical protein K2I13_04145, partial [Alistipes sp.]|nr:hypothetical protein [Alistipes sp.]
SPRLLAAACGETPLSGRSMRHKGRSMFSQSKTAAKKKTAPRFCFAAPLPAAGPFRTKKRPPGRKAEAPL